MSRSRSLAALLVIVIVTGSAMALSLERRTPGIEFPKGYDKHTSDAVMAVLDDKQFHYLGGLTSYWPPAFGTTLVYEGETKNLNRMIARLLRIDAIRVRVTFSKDLSKETGSALTAGSWWVKYSQETPSQITIRINLAAKEIDPSQLDLVLEPSGEEARVHN